MQQPINPGDTTNASVALLGGTSSTERRRIWQGLTRIAGTNRKMQLGLIIVGFFLLVAALGPIFIHQGSDPFTDDIAQAPSLTHLLGTTSRGEDVFIQLVEGTRRSVTIGFIVAIVATALSVVFGLTSGYFGGLVDDLLSLFINVFIVLPGFPMAIVISSFVPRQADAPTLFLDQSAWIMVLILSLTSWSWGARVLRAQTLTLRRREFVTAAKAVGERPFRLIFFEILPNEIAIVASSFVGTMIHALLSQIALEFLGLGNLSVVSWGSMLYWAQTTQALVANLWWWFIPPGLCMAILGAGLTLVNFGIDEIANPRLQSVNRKFMRIKKQKAVTV